MSALRRCDFSRHVYGPSERNSFGNITGHWRLGVTARGHFAYRQSWQWRVFSVKYGVNGCGQQPSRTRDRVVGVISKWVAQGVSKSFELAGLL